MFINQTMGTDLQNVTPFAEQQYSNLVKVSDSHLTLGPHGIFFDVGKLLC